jgi:hypothetical protein
MGAQRSPVHIVKGNSGDKIVWYERNTVELSNVIPSQRFYGVLNRFAVRPVSMRQANTDLAEIVMAPIQIH